MMNWYRMTTRWEFGTKWKLRKVENLWVGDKAQRECQWRHVCLRDTPRYERQWQHSCLRGTSQCAHLQPDPLCVVRILSGGVVVFSSSLTHAPWLKFESFMSSPWPSTCVRSLHLDPPFLLLALPSTPFPLPQLHEVCGRPAQLLQRECGLYWRVLPLLKTQVFFMIRSTNKKQTRCADGSQMSSQRDRIENVWNKWMGWRTLQQ